MRLKAMVDVRLLYPAEKYEAAMRLAESLAAAGYSVEKEALPHDQAFPRLGPEAGKAKALLLIWSRGLVSAAMAAGGLAEARRHPNLVEVSADGIEPASGSEISPVVLLCGWRGQSFHPGWQKILAEVKRLCGTREVAGARPPGVSPEARAKASTGAARPSRRPVARAAIAAGALIAATLGAATAFEWNAPSPEPAPEARPALAAVGGPAPAASAAPRAAEAPTAEVDPLPAAPPPAAATNPRAPARTLSADRASPRRASNRLAAVAEPEVKRYSRKNSKTMRLFCQRSGRSTPQCRTFARSMRDLGG